MTTARKWQSQPQECMKNKEFSEAPSLRSAEPRGRASCWCWPRGHVVRISSVLGLVITGFFGKQLLTICHSFVGELSRWTAAHQLLWL